MSPLPGQKPNLPQVNFDFLLLKPVCGRWTRFCWWLSRKLGGRSVFGKRDLTGGGSE